MLYSATIHLETSQDHIIQGCVENQAKSQEILYKQLYETMVKVCWRYCKDLAEAEALYNAAMLKVFLKIKQYGYKGSFEGWVKRIVINTCIDHVRKNTSFKELYLDDVKEVQESVAASVYDKFQVAEIMQLVKNLPKNTSAVFNLYVLDGYKHNEIAEIIGISEGTSKWHLNEARRLLKIALVELENTTQHYKHV